MKQFRELFEFAPLTGNSKGDTLVQSSIVGSGSDEVLLKHQGPLDK